MFFLFAFFIILLLTIIIFAIKTARIEIEIKNLCINTEKPEGQKVNKNSKIYVYVLFFKKIKLFKKNIRDIKNLDLKLKNKKINMELLKNKDLKINYKELLKNIEIKEIDLSIQIGTQNSAITAVLVGFISGLLGVILRKPKYDIVPIYSNSNLLKVKLDCIISLNLTQYIYKLIFDLKKFGKVAAKRTVPKAENSAKRTVPFEEIAKVAKN